MNDELLMLKKNNFSKCLNNLNKRYKGKKILIYGAGKLFETILNNYDLSKLNIVGVVDKKFKSNETFYNYKTFTIENIDKINFDLILVSLKDCSKIIQLLKNNYPTYSIYPLFENKNRTINNLSVLEIRNFQRNANIILETKNIKKTLFYEEKKAFLAFIEKISFLITKKINIPQIEFVLTTRCTLKCQNCLNYIPYIKENEHINTSLSDFEYQISNLTKSVNKIRKLILIGGETFLVKDLEKYIEICAKNKCIEQIQLFTNGTLLINSKVLNTIKKYRNKILIYISNYSKNEKIKNRLKYCDIINQCKDNNIQYVFDESLEWEYCSPLPSKAVRSFDYRYFSKCTNPCVSVFDGKLFVCPRAGIFSIKQIYNQNLDDYVDLNNADYEKLSNDLINFYSTNYFTACNYCSVLEDKLKPMMTPAIQIEKEER